MISKPFLQCVDIPNVNILFWSIVKTGEGGEGGEGVGRSNCPFRKQAMPFGRDEQFSLLSLSFANEGKILNLGLD